MVREWWGLVARWRVPCDRGRSVTDQPAEAAFNERWQAEADEPLSDRPGDRGVASDRGAYLAKQANIMTSSIVPGRVVEQPGGRQAAVGQADGVVLLLPHRVRLRDLRQVRAASPSSRRRCSATSASGRPAASWNAGRPADGVTKRAGRRRPGNAWRTPTVMLEEHTARGRPCRQHGGRGPSPVPHGVGPTLRACVLCRGTRCALVEKVDIAMRRVQVAGLRVSVIGLAGGSSARRPGAGATTSARPRRDRYAPGRPAARSGSLQGWSGPARPIPSDARTNRPRGKSCGVSGHGSSSSQARGPSTAGGGRAGSGRCTG